MKRLNKKLLTFALTGAFAASLCAATVGVVSSADEADGVAVSSVFSPAASNGATVDVETATGAEQGTLRFTLADGQSAYLRRELALKWYESVEDVVTEKYLDMKFSFKDKNFKSVTFKMESASSVVTEEDKAVNEITFEVTEGNMSVIVNGDTDGKTPIDTLDINLALAKAESGNFGEFDVTVNGAKVGTFKNIGANYADYVFDEMMPLTIEAEADEEKSAVVLFKELNGQKFDNIKGNLVTDTAAPVLVVNEEISSLQFGTAFALSYEKIDVLQDSNLKEEKYYYQYNPADEAADYSSALSTSTYFMNTVYYMDGTTAVKKNNEDGTLKATSVMATEGQEYVSIKFTLADEVNEKDYYLSWYAEAGTTVSKAVKDGKSIDYVVIDKNTDGPTYSYIVADNTDGNNTNKYAENGVVGDDLAQENAKSAFDEEISAYKKLLQAEADDIKASSNASINLPALDWLVKDNGGYRGLRFTISYKTPSSSSAKTASGLLYNGLKFTTSEEGVYEFKVFANDVAGNKMYYYYEEELVEVSTSNVWDIEEIPSFTFKVADNPISIKKPTKDTDKRVEKLLDQTYTLSGITVEGAKSEKNAFALYRFDNQSISESNLLKIGYDEIIAEASTMYDEVGDKYESYCDLYVHVYAKKIAELVNEGTVTADQIKAIEDCFVRIDEYNAEITEDNDEAAWEAYNKYNWDAEAKSFKTVEEGNYFIFGDYYEDYLPMQRAAAYKLIVVESEADVIKGESQFSAWVKNNVVSVILFGVAGLMLIAIIVLLLVHPSDETLEDVDEKANESAKTKKKKDK